MKAGVKAFCPYCGKTVALNQNRFVQHSVNGALCPLTRQRAPIQGFGEWDDECRARLLADLAWQVQDADPGAVWTYLTCLPAGELQRMLLFALAALPIDKTVDGMWSWVRALPVARLQVAS